MNQQPVLIGWHLFGPCGTSKPNYMRRAIVRQVYPTGKLTKLIPQKFGFEPPKHPCIDLTSRLLKLLPDWNGIGTYIRTYYSFRRLR